MGEQERLRSKVMEMVSVSYRQAKLLKAAYLTHGDSGLVHGNCGRVSNNCTSEAGVEQAVTLYREKYPDFGPTFAAEKLSETDGIAISVSTLRRRLIARGDWQGRKRNAVYRSRRERRECFWELIQFDGSHYKWFEGRGRKCCLITMIDDATNIRLSRFYEEETIAGVMEVFSLWIKNYGIPEALYCDRKNAFILTREPTDEELLRGIREPKSHFGRACEKLGVAVIGAHSPQAKAGSKEIMGLTRIGW